MDESRKHDIELLIKESNTHKSKSHETVENKLLKYSSFIISSFETDLRI
jgi:hypothetical protein